MSTTYRHDFVNYKQDNNHRDHDVARYDFRSLSLFDQTANSSQAVYDSEARGLCMLP